MKPMLPVLSSRIPEGPEWVYEVKYDGFRAILYIEEESVSMVSRNGKDLAVLFPEIIKFVSGKLPALKPYLPLTMDGELVCLKTAFTADFQELQTRGRLKSKAKIQQYSSEQPCRLLVFDLLVLNGQSISNEPYYKRKENLHKLFNQLLFPLMPSADSLTPLQMIPYTLNPAELWEQIELHGAEGMVAKQPKGRWEAGKRTETWKKIKNYRRTAVFITAYNQENGYFETGLYKDDTVISPGSFSHGIKGKEREALIQTIKNNALSRSRDHFKIAPALCVQIKFLSFLNEFREPSFDSFLFKGDPSLCTWEQLQLDSSPLHHDVQITHPDKPVWENPSINKRQYILYLIQIAPHMLPLLNSRALTLIRYPHGTSGERFYQKNVPDYAPSFVQTAEDEGIEYIICRHLSDLVWLGNQLALEFHLPFKRYFESMPMEIVFDLDPPSGDKFSLAIMAAKEIHQLCKEFGLASYPKLSGGKGIQVHIPLSGKKLTFEDTRTFTGFIADYLTKRFPDQFTTERFKKKRGGKLYLDYLQHGEGKTIVAPYSPRGAEGARVAAPLLWEEVTDELSPEEFTIVSVFEHIKKRGCPFEGYLSSPQDEAVSDIIKFIKKAKQQL